MNKEIAKRWVDAARSGEYKQTRFALKRNNCFCFLGLLCELHREEFGGKWERKLHGVVYMGYRCSLPAEVCEWAGIVNQNVMTKDNESHHLSHLNDTKLFTFEQLANLVEAQAETL